MGLYAPIYENMKEGLMKKAGEFKAWHILISAMVAKGFLIKKIFFIRFLACLIGISIVIIYPVVVIRARLQDSRKKIVFHKVKNEEEEVNLRAVCRILWRNEGIKGFYSGIRFDVARILISNAIIFMVYEGVKYEVLEGWLKRNFEE